MSFLPVFKEPDQTSIVLERLKKGDQVLERGNKLREQGRSLGVLGFFHVVTKAGTVGFIKPAHAAPHNFQAEKESTFDETDYNQRMNLRHQDSSTEYQSKILFLGSFPKPISTPTNGKIYVIEQSLSYGFGYTFSKKMDLPKKNNYYVGTAFRYFYDKINSPMIQIIV